MTTIPTEETQEIPSQEQKQSDILELEVWYRTGPAFTDKHQCEVIYGRANVSEEYDEELCRQNYPYRCVGTLRIQPLDVPVIVRCIDVDNATNPRHYIEDLHIYTDYGWKHIKVKEEYVWD